MDPQELVPLEEGVIPRPQRPAIPAHRNCYLAPRSCYKVPLRLCRLLAMLIILPSLFIFIPLYLRYRVFSGQMYPMGMTDMRLIDSKISTTWCQRQVVRSNTTFNAFVVPGPPELTQDLVPVSMTRELELGDDMKEYWGFYLLKGSSVTVSTCVRYPGASLIMIKGYKHLQDCAYIGDDSSEEIEEIEEAYELGLINYATLMQKKNTLNKSKGKTNDPGAMRRHKAGVSFHDQSNVDNVTSSNGENGNNVDMAEADHDPKELLEILARLHALRQAAKNQHAKLFQPPSNIENIHTPYRYRDANVDKEERRWLTFQDIDGNKSNILNSSYSRRVVVQNTTLRSEINKESNSTEKDETDTNAFAYREVLASITNIVNEPKNITNEEEIQLTVSLNENKSSPNADGNTNDTGPKKVFVKDAKEIISPPVVTLTEIAKDGEIAANDDVSGLKVVATEYTKEGLGVEPEPNSKEVFEDVLRRLQALGDRGKRVLIKLHQTMGVEYHERAKPTVKSDIMSVVTGSGEELDRLRKVLVEAIDEEKTRSERKKKRQEAFDQARNKRESMMTKIELQKSFNEDDEARDYAAEEDLEPDGYAEHHEIVNETTPLDMSNSEFWSSFSSSEEALLECEGLILNLPLTPHTSCVKNATEGLSFTAAKANALTYRVPANGYYFFVFSSENEVNTNFIKAKFELQKTRYDVARTTLRECTNSTERCDLPLDIFTSQKVVLEVPLRNNDSLWNEQFVIISECEPRTSIYLTCVIAVPVLIIIFAFQ